MRRFQKQTLDADSQAITPKVRAVTHVTVVVKELEVLTRKSTDTDRILYGDGHWDRLYYPESMSGVISPTTNVLSSLTLALMEDSGWYRADYGMSRMSTWGLGAGCDFVNEPCLTKTDSGSEIPEHGKGYFCNQQNEEGCSSELTHKQGCTVLTINTSSPEPTSRSISGFRQTNQGRTATS
jgi:hypothetical protein